MEAYFFLSKQCKDEWPRASAVALLYLALLVHIYLPYDVALILVVQSGGHHTHIPGSKMEGGTESERCREKGRMGKVRFSESTVMFMLASHWPEVSHMAMPSGKKGWEMQPLFWIAKFPF